MKVFRQSLLLITFTLFSFDVFADSDGDGLPDENDPCPQIDGRYSSESSGTNPDISDLSFVRVRALAGQY